MATTSPVLFVTRNSEGEVRWMEVRDYLKRASDSRKKPVRQIVFEGERFDVMSVRRWREKVLGGG
ncbi:MAG: hypothetical protein U1F71_21430 [Verrucomicrobiaceae bacterium]